MQNFVDSLGAHYSEDKSVLGSIPKGLERYEIIEGCTVLSATALENGECLKEVVLPASFQILALGDFDHCPNLERLVIRSEGLVTVKPLNRGKHFQTIDFADFFNQYPHIKEIYVPEAVKADYSTLLKPVVKSIEEYEASNIEHKKIDCCGSEESRESDSQSTPPQEIIFEVNCIIHEIESCMPSLGIGKIKDLLFNCAPHLVEIKEKLGAQHAYYIYISDVLANAALNMVIQKYNELVNDQLQENLKRNPTSIYDRLMWMLRHAYIIISNIERLNTSDNFKRDRLEPNSNIIYDFISRLDGFKDTGNSFYISYCGKLAGPFINSYYDAELKQKSPYAFESVVSRSHYNSSLSFTTDILGQKLSPTYGFMTGYLFEPSIDLSTEYDYYISCEDTFKSKDVSSRSFSNYLEKFPNGKYVSKVKQLKNIVDNESKIYGEHKNTIFGLKEYIDKYPNGWYINVAKKVYDDLLYKEYDKKNKLRTYIAKNPNGNHVREAKDKLRKQIKKWIFIAFCLVVFGSLISICIYHNGSIWAALILSVILCSICFSILTDKNGDWK